MLVVSAAAEPAWTPVMGAEVLFRPIDRAMMRRARRAAVKALGDAAAADSDASAAEQIDELGDALSYALLVEGIADWRGVCLMTGPDDDGAGATLDCTPENVALVLADPIIFDAFDAAYVVPFVTRERERAEPGNASAASPSGIGEAATPDSDTVSLPAMPASEVDAQNVPTGSRKRKRTPKKASGGS